jgi:hypothetical protein
MAPTSDEVAVAVKVLRAEADSWAGAADVLRSAAAALAARALPRAAFSFKGGGVADLYEALRSKTAARLAAGAANADDIATALRISATAYETEEAAGVHRMNRVY